MLVSRLHQFFEEIQKHSDPLLPDLQRDFGDLDKDFSLQSAQIDCLRDYFSKRWEQVRDKALDYTFDPTGVNEPWVNLAKELGAELNILYLKILIPVLVDNVEPDMLSRMCNDQDPRTICVGDDDKSWHRVFGLFKKIREDAHPLYTYDSANKMKPRPLSIKELLRLRSRKGAISFTWNEQLYESFWDYLIREAAPAWEKKGKFPHGAKQLLLKFLDSYLTLGEQQMDSQQQFQRDYEQLSLQLMGAAIDDANHFYAIRLSTEKGERRLLDLILDCLEKKLDLEDSLSLAEWLCKEDGSLIVKSAKANPVYKCLAKGLFLTNEALKIDLESLLSGCHSELIPLLNQLVFHLGECHPEQLPAKETINRLRELYASRFRLILDKELDYLRMQKGANQLWIALAQTLAGAGLIDANYYRFLIPTLKPENDNELLSGDPVTYYPLSHYILAENGSYLIFLGNCVQQHIARRAFLNCSVDPPSRLTIKERQRLIFAAAEYVNYFLNQVKRDHSPPLLKSTVDAVRDLVNGSVYNQGLYANRVLDWATQTRQVMASYDSFRKFYNQLPAEERHNLNAQSISRDFEEGTFEEYFDQIWGQDDGDWEKENECTSSFGQAFVKLVTDYSHKPFKKELEDSKALNLEYMRSQSKKRVYKDSLPPAECLRRIKIIVVSLMSHSFQNVGRTINLKLWDCENKVTATGEKILDKIKHLIENNEQEHVQFDYYMLTEGVAGEALTRSPKTRTPDTTIWLKSINEETLFNDAQLTCFDPELLFVGLLPRLETRDATTEAILNFLDQILKTLMQEQQNENKIWIRINIKFQKLLSELRLSKQEEILDELRKMYKEKTAGEIKSAFDSLSGQFLKRRVEIHTVKTKAVSPRFFSQSTVMPGTETLPFKEQVKTIELGEKEKKSTTADYLEFLGKRIPDLKDNFVSSANNTALVCS